MKAVQRVLNKNRQSVNKSWLITMIILAVLLAASIICKLLTGTSILMSIFGKNNTFCKAHALFASIITPKALSEVAKAIGLSSFLIGWIYVSLDKVESGFYYSELLEVIYPLYNCFVLIHAAALLSALWLASATYWEGAMISFIIVLIDCFPQWTTLKLLIFSTENRREIAKRRWNNIIDSFSDQLTDKNYQIKKDCGDVQAQIYKLADVISLAPGHNYQRMINCLSTALCELVDCFTRSKTLEDYQALITGLIPIWDHLLSARSSNDRNIIIRDIVRNIGDSSRNWPMKESVVRALCLSYYLWLSRHFMQLNHEIDNPSREILILISNDLELTKQYCFSPQEPSWNNYVDTAYTMLVWFHFFQSHIMIEKDLLIHVPRRSPMPREINHWKAFVRVRFPTLSYDESDRILNAAFAQIRLTVNNMCDKKQMIMATSVELEMH